jgi:hypothetical protein
MGIFILVYFRSFILELFGIKCKYMLYGGIIMKKVLQICLFIFALSFAVGCEMPVSNSANNVTYIIDEMEAKVERVNEINTTLIEWTDEGDTEGFVTGALNYVINEVTYLSESFFDTEQDARTKLSGIQDSPEEVAEVEAKIDSLVEKFERAIEIYRGQIEVFTPWLIDADLRGQLSGLATAFGGRYFGIAGIHVDPFHSIPLFRFNHDGSGQASIPAENSPGRELVDIKWSVRNENLYITFLRENAPFDYRFTLHASGGVIFLDYPEGSGDLNPRNAISATEKSFKNITVTLEDQESIKQIDTTLGELIDHKWHLFEEDGFGLSRIRYEFRRDAQGLRRRRFGEEGAVLAVRNYIDERIETLADIYHSRMNQMYDLRNINVRGDFNRTENDNMHLEYILTSLCLRNVINDFLNREFSYYIWEAE